MKEDIKNRERIAIALLEKKNESLIKRNYPKHTYDIIWDNDDSEGVVVVMDKLTLAEVERYIEESRAWQGAYLVL